MTEELKTDIIIKPLIGSLKNLLMQVVAEFWNIRK